MTSASLTLRSSNGVVLSTSEYQLDSLLGFGKWSTTREKIGPVVAALVTGFED
ncbi:hypothetical protein [Xylophilus sp.]|uniref:hypothetical protein n=1 Tax=Xylophilus sp. TaxID=2653893 RepID=UPI0013B9E1C9|nr:hypothetical protein [Xylophilus sp.]KAF1045006.1 MAG: hypothetical protein GAK38_03232 [Xylophilus sp.]